MLLTKQRHRVRQFRDGLIDQPLRQVEQARQQLRKGVDVLFLGDSTCLFGSPDDADPAMIPELVGRALGGASVVVLAGPGFSAPVHTEALRILGTLDERPKAVVSSVCVRTSTSVHVTRHPVYSYTHSLNEMARITSARHRIRSFGRGSTPTEADYDRFHALPVRTRWSGETTIGAFRDQLRGHGPHPWPVHLERLLFDYFHGEEVTDQNPGLDRWREFGQQVRDYGVPTASYLTPAPVERGEWHFPGEFAEVTATNRKLVEGAIAETAGDSWQFVDAGLADADYLNSNDGVEHFNLTGRLKIARAVAAALD